MLNLQLEHKEEKLTSVSSFAEGTWLKTISAAADAHCDCWKTTFIVFKLQVFDYYKFSQFIYKNNKKVAKVHTFTSVRV
jgi:hypothetical protein